MFYSCGNKANYSRNTLFKCHVLISFISVVCQTLIQPHTHNNTFTWLRRERAAHNPFNLYLAKKQQCVCVTVWGSPFAEDLSPWISFCNICICADMCLHSCVAIPGIQHCRVLAPEHLSFRYRPWQMYRLGWQMPPSLVQLMSLLGPIETLLLPVFLIFFLEVLALGLPSFAVVSFLFTLTLLSAFLSGLCNPSPFLFSCSKAQLNRTS